MNPLDWLLEGTIAIGDSHLLVREVVGNGFGLASAILGMRRLVRPDTETPAAAGVAP